MNAMSDLNAPMSASEVKEARLRLGFTTQEQLADALGLTATYRKDTVRSWESGRVPISGPSRLALRMMLRDKGLLVEPPPKRKGKPKSEPQQP